MFSALSITEAYTTNESLFDVWLHVYEAALVALDCELVFPIERAIIYLSGISHNNTLFTRNTKQKTAVW